MINLAELDERIERCLAILADNPQSQVFAALAEAYRRRGEFGRAFAVCKSGIKHHPDYAPAHIVMAKLYLHQKMLPDAERSLQRAIELEGQTRITDMLEAELFMEMDDLPHAQAVLDRLRLMDPSNQVVDELYGKLRRLKDTSREQIARREEVHTADTQESESVEPMDQISPAQRDPVVPTTLTWNEWSRTVSELPDVVGAFAFDPTDRVMAVDSHPQVDEDSLSGVLSMFRTIGVELRKAGFGTLEEIRIETEQHELWSSTFMGFVWEYTASPPPSRGWPSFQPHNP